MTTDRNEHQARKLLALGLDEFGHHTEAANVRKGIDLDEYKVDLWAIRAALDAQPSPVVKQNLTTQPAAAQEAVAWQRRYIKTGGPWYSISKEIYETTKNGEWAGRYEVRELYAAPVTAAPADRLHAHLLHMLGAKDHEDAGRIIGELHAATMRTPAAPGIDIEQFREPVTFWFEHIVTHPFTETNAARLRKAKHLLALIDASPKGSLNEQFGNAEGLDSPKGGSEARAYTTGHCENHKKPGGCPLHNLQCGYPQCDRKPASDAEVRP